MGGNGPLVVLDDADLDAAVTATLTAAFLNAGQSCTAGERILVQAGVHDDYLERLTVAIRERIRLGDPMDGATTMGPLNNEAEAVKMDAPRRRRARPAARASSPAAIALPSIGSPTFYEATVLDDVTRRWRWPARRPSGRSCPVTRIRDVDEAMAVVNGSSVRAPDRDLHGDLGRGLRFAESASAGWVNINEGTNYWESHLPFGGRAGSAERRRPRRRPVLDGALTELKTVILNLG